MMHRRQFIGCVQLSKEKHNLVPRAVQTVRYTARSSHAVESVVRGVWSTFKGMHSPLVESCKQMPQPCSNASNGPSDIKLEDSCLIEKHPSQTTSQRNSTISQWLIPGSSHIHLPAHQMSCMICSVSLERQQSSSVERVGRKGKIINIASINSYIANHYISPYAASKGAVLQVTKALSNE